MIFKITSQQDFLNCLINIKDCELFDPNFISDMVGNICTSLSIEQSSHNGFTNFNENDCLNNCPVYVLYGHDTVEEIYENMELDKESIMMYEFIETISDFEGNIIAYKLVYITSDDGAGKTIYADSNNEFFTEMYNHQ